MEALIVMEIQQSELKPANGSLLFSFLVSLLYKLVLVVKSVLGYNEIRILNQYSEPRASDARLLRCRSELGPVSD